jgi:CheY-like chemotaxis protein
VDSTVDDEYAPRFRVLIVDNDEGPHEEAEKHLRRLTDSIDIVHARSAAEGKVIAQREFFNLAFIDLMLGDASGTSVIRSMSISSPSCCVVPMTKYLDEHASDVLSLLDPDSPVISIVDKAEDEADWFTPIAKRMLDDWRTSHVRLRGAGSLLDALTERSSHITRDLQAAGAGTAELRSSRSSLIDEVAYLAAGLFGGAGAVLVDERPLVNLRVMRRGFSSSIVVEAQLEYALRDLSDVVVGNRCVVKIGPRPEIASEVERYNKVVRYGVALDYRVEMLGACLGDALGAVCYSFAGGRTSTLSSLDDLLGPDDMRLWEDIFSRMFTPSASNWYSVRGEIPSLKEYFVEELRISPTRSLNQLSRWLESLVHGVPSLRLSRRTGRASELQSGDLVLELPDRAILGRAELVRAVPGCLIHGDLHGGNVLVDAERTPPACKFIDYRNSGLGPRLLDFVALQSTVRLAHVRRMRGSGESWPRKPTAEWVSRIMAETLVERQLLRGETPPDSWWVHASLQLDDLRRENFPGSTDEEMLYTSFLYALGLFRIVHLDWHIKVRLLAWLSALTEKITTQGRGGNLP